MTGPQIDIEAARLWLRILHQGNPGRVHIAATGAWSGPSFPTADLDAAVQRVAELDAARPLGVYVRMTTLMAPLKRGDRGGNADSLTLPALWADLDIAGPAHKDDGLPPDWAAVEAIVAASGLPVPTLWVDSGHGAYPVWLIDPPQVLDANSLEDAAKVSAGWQKVIGAASRKLGFHYGEGVGDLARVLRIPGTINRKIAGDERLCRIVAGGSGHGYPYGTLQQHCAAALAAITPEPRPVTQHSLFTPPVTPRTASSELTPGDDWAAQTSWAQILEPHGWRLTRMRGDIGDWCRPGKAEGISATTNGLGTDRFHNFSTSSGFDVGSYSKLGVLATLEHGGDMSAATSALRHRGFGGDAIADYLGGLTDVMPPLGRDRDPGPASAVSYTPDFQAKLDVVHAALGGHDDRPHCVVVNGPCPGNDRGDICSGPCPPDGPPASPELDAETLAKLRFQQMVAADMVKKRVSRASNKAVDAEEFAVTWREPTYRRSLTDELAEPDDPIRYRVDKLLTVGGNAVLTAAFKAGKTTMCNNLLRSLADGDPFLGRFDVHPADDRRIAVFNYEVGEGQYRQWLRKIGIHNTDRISVLNLRGFRLPLIHALVEDWIAKWLQEQKIGTWIVDPFARAMVGCGDENSNMDVGVVLDALDVIKGRAGVGELILPTHTGRAEQQAGAERARGATRLDDWADARWLLTLDDQGRRFFRANGRDVDVDEELLSFDEATGRLTMGGQDRRGMARRDHDQELVAWVREHPGLGKNEIADLRGGNRNAVFGRLDAAISARSVYTVPAGRGKMLHYATPERKQAAGDGDV